MNRIPSAEQAFVLALAGDEKSGLWMDQAVFETVYRGRQSIVHHLAYMRIGKVFLTLRALETCGVSLAGKSLFDYGFGAGTFFHYCPRGTRLFGVEIDPANVGEVLGFLAAKGVESDLRTIDVDSWHEHPLLARQYDFFLCSHVLEHLPDPVAFLRRVHSCIAPGGHFLGLVPLNERAKNPHHVNEPDRPMIEGWAREAGFDVAFYEENDPFVYWFQPLFAADRGWRHKAAQAVSLSLGIAAKALGRRAWFAIAPLFARFTLARPTQAVFLLNPKS
jgi:SAM-dependent methyltransferase